MSEPQGADDPPEELSSDDPSEDEAPAAEVESDEAAVQGPGESEDDDSAREPDVRPDATSDFGDKTDVELADLYDLGRARMASGDEAEARGAEALMRAAVEEAVRRPHFGEPLPGGGSEQARQEAASEGVEALGRGSPRSDGVIRRQTPCSLRIPRSASRLSTASTWTSTEAGRTVRSGCGGRLVAVVHAGHPRQVSAAGPGVVALGVALLAQLERAVDVDLEEGQSALLVESPGASAVGGVRADERHERDDPGVGQEAGGVSGPAHVLGPVGRVEARGRR